MVQTYPSINGMFRLPVVDGVPYIYGKVPAKKLPELFPLFYGNFNDSVYITSLIVSAPFYNTL